MTEEELRKDRLNRFITACLTTNITSKDFNIKDTYALLGCLTDMPNTKVNSARSNHSKLDRAGMTYQLIQLCMRLFVAGLHTDTPCDENGFPDPEYNFRTRYLEKRLKEPVEENRRLQREINKLESGEHIIELRKLREKVLDDESELLIQKNKIEKLEAEMEFKDDKIQYSISKKMYEGLQKENEALKKLLDKQ